MDRQKDVLLIIIFKKPVRKSGEWPKKRKAPRMIKFKSLIKAVNARNLARQRGHISHVYLKCEWPTDTPVNTV